MAVTIRTPRELSADDLGRVEALAHAVALRDGAPPLSDQALTRLTSTQPRHVLAQDGDTVLGYAQLDGESLELVADPAATLDALLASVEDAASGEVLAWSHGQAGPVAAALQRRGYRRARVLHQLRAPLPAAPPVPALPPGVTMRGFAVGRDEPEWLRVNAAAFAHHPEQGGWTRADVAAREAEPWFEPAGLLLAERGNTLLGFHWTKIHDDRAGEVYVLGVDPASQGLGLGRILLDAGLAHLYERGCRTVLLYVDESNTTAMRLYESSGFDRYDVDVQWQLNRDLSSPA